jgi:hypothetical protein
LSVLTSQHCTCAHWRPPMREPSGNTCSPTARDPAINSNSTRISGTTTYFTAAAAGPCCAAARHGPSGHASDRCHLFAWNDSGAPSARTVVGAGRIPGVSPVPNGVTGTIAIPNISSGAACSTVATSPLGTFGSPATYDGGGMAMATGTPTPGTAMSGTSASSGMSGVSTSSAISATSGLSTTSGMLETSGLSGTCGSG